MRKHIKGQWTRLDTFQQHSVRIKIETQMSEKEDQAQIRPEDEQFGASVDYYLFAPSSYQHTAPESAAFDFIHPQQADCDGSTLVSSIQYECLIRWLPLLMHGTTVCLLLLTTNLPHPALSCLCHFMRGFHAAEMFNPTHRLR